MTSNEQALKNFIALKHTEIAFGQDLWRERQLVRAVLSHLSWRWHGIGVLQGYVHESETGRELRVHIWSRKLMLPGILASGNAHNHRFGMRSMVLHGDLAHTEWQLTDGQGFALYDFVHARLHTDDNRSDMQRLPGEVAVCQVPVRIASGNVYTFERGAYHDSYPMTDLVVTLVEKVDQQEAKARVIAPAHIPPVPAFSGGTPDPNLVSELLDQARAALAE